MHSQTLWRSCQSHRKRSATGWACVSQKDELLALGTQGFQH
ncbi:hypothetical protein APV28_0594 [Comamonas testosteroni]|nr:hypothetical protein APV28_0594 [Comamonas testosteroni]